MIPEKGRTPDAISLVNGVTDTLRHFSEPGPHAVLASGSLLALPVLIPSRPTEVRHRRANTSLAPARLRETRRSISTLPASSCPSPPRLAYIGENLDKGRTVASSIAPYGSERPAPRHRRA